MIKQGEMIVLAKPVYESLPYLYLAIGYGLITSDPSLFSSVSGMLFFFAGALVWNMRSHFRRRDPDFFRKNESSHPTRYELKPFLLS